MKRQAYCLKRAIFLALILAFALGPYAPNPVAHAATTTTKYLNGRIAFNSSRDGNYEIYAMNADGSDVTRITNHIASDVEPAWSPDGTKLTFRTNRDGNREIYTMNADGSNQARITNNAGDDYVPTWSPDGTKIAFQSDRDGNNEIYTMQSDGSNQTRLTTNSVSDTYPTWSPDSTKIALSTTRDGNSEIYTMNADGSNPTRLTNNIPAYDYHPAWSPDSTKISFISDRDGLVGPYNEEIYTMNADGTNVIRVTNTSAEEETASYSPDGTKLLATVYPDVNYVNSGLFTMNIDGSNRSSQLTNGGGYEDNYGSQPWQPLPYTETVNNDGSKTSTISPAQNYAATDYTIASGETLVLNGSLCDVVVSSGATLQGTGTVTPPDCTLTVEPGGTIAPGNSPGCLASGNLILSGTYQAELAGTTPCTGYDQLQATGTVTLTNSTLTTTLLNDFIPTPGNSFTLITNDSTDPVTGTFQNLPEGATITIGTSVFKISYVGGDGNDVVLTAQSVPGAPETGWGNNLNSLKIFAAVSATAIVIIGATLWTQRRQQAQDRV